MMPKIFRVPNIHSFRTASSVSLLVSGSAKDARRSLLVVLGLWGMGRHFHF